MRNVQKFIVKQRTFVEVLEQANKLDYAKIVKVLTNAYSLGK